MDQRVKKAAVDLKLELLATTLERHDIPNDIVPGVLEYYQQYLNGINLIDEYIKIDTRDPNIWEPCVDNSLDSVTKSFLHYLSWRYKAAYYCGGPIDCKWEAWVRGTEPKSNESCEAYYDTWSEWQGKVVLRELEEWVKDRINQQKASGEDVYPNTLMPAFIITRAKYAKYYRDLELVFDYGGKYADLQALRFEDYDLPAHLEIWQNDYIKYPASEEDAMVQLVAKRYGITNRYYLFRSPGLREIAEDLEAPYEWVLQVLKKYCQYWWLYDNTMNKPIMDLFNEEEGE
jgi:hypothetical protein